MTHEMKETLKIIFMGTPDFATAALQALIDSEHEVIAVYSQPPRPKGRGHKMTPSPVDHLARMHGIPVYTPKSLKSAEAQTEFAALEADVAIVAAYGLILPGGVLKAPKYGCLNIHASLLPRWRGAAPIQYAIWQGDKESGVTIMQMEEGLDTGPMIAKTTTPITGDTTASTLHDTLAADGAALLLEVLADIKNLKAEAQDDDLSTYASMLSKDDGRIDWQQQAEEIDRQVRALNPWPGAFTEWEGERVKILKVNVILSEVEGSPSAAGDPSTSLRYAQDDDVEPGTILDKHGHIACGDGTVLQLLKIQPAGKKPMDFVSAVNGGYVKL